MEKEHSVKVSLAIKRENGEVKNCTMVYQKSRLATWRKMDDILKEYFKET